MSAICAEIPRSTVRDADIVLSKIGMSFRVQAAIDEIDFDPSPAYATIDQLITAAETIREGAPLDCASVLMSWSGPAASAACDYIECQRSFWDHVADFFLWLAENLLQIIDYVVDLVRWIATWLAWIATVAAIFIFVIDVIALVVTGGAGSIAAILSAPVFAVLGSIAVVAGTVSLLLWLVNLGVEWLQRLIRDQRAKFCGDGLPSLPDWDPGGYPPAIPSGEGD